jgi:hypothetical protein
MNSPSAPTYKVSTWPRCSRRNVHLARKECPIGPCRSLQRAFILVSVATNGAGSLPDEEGFAPHQDSRGKEGR